MTDHRGSALIAAVLAVALAGGMAAALAELARLALVRARLDHHGTRAWFLAEGGLAETVAGLEPGTDFSAWLTAGPAAPGTPGTPWTYEATPRDDPDDEPDAPLVDANRRVLLAVTGFGPEPIRRRLEAVIGRAPEPFLPGAATLAGGVRELTRDFLLDGRDFDVTTGCTIMGGAAPRAGLALPEGATLPGLPDPRQITGAGETPSIVELSAPDLTPIADAPDAVRLPSGPVGGTLGTLADARLTIVDGDATIDGGSAGAGALYVAGRLAVRGTLAFTGVVAAAEGIEIVAGGTLVVCGAVWAAGEPALDARGAGAVRASAGAIEVAARVAPLPARAEILATRELF